MKAGSAGAKREAIAVAAAAEVAIAGGHQEASCKQHSC